MFNFTVPYPNELIYSTVARTGTYLGISSPKQLLDEVYGDRKVIATMDLPCHLQAISNQLKRTGRYSVVELVYQHTMFPLYAPFVSEDHRLKALKMMAASSQGAVHLMLGVAASRVKSISRFRYCDVCMQEQQIKYGECFWLREWYFPGLRVCPDHGPLTLLSENISDHRHLFLPLQHAIGKTQSCADVSSEQVPLACLARELMQLSPGASPTFEQWTAFYHNLAADFGFSRGKQVLHDQIYNHIKQQFSVRTLSELHLCGPVSESFWLRTMFRKHRKAFSYLEHLIVWAAFLPGMNPAEILKQVLKVGSKMPPTVERTDAWQAPASVDLLKRETWQRLTLDHGIKAARKVESGGAVYAWLYRHDRAWLLKFNRQQKQPRELPGFKIDWHQRDLLTIRALRKLPACTDLMYKGPRISANYLLSHLPNRSSIEKNLDKLPLVRMYLQRYTETITEYQLRRLMTTCAEFHKDGVPIKQWVALRNAGLSKERLTEDTQRVLNELQLF
ncbi:transposase [Vibrio cholerae]|uniref:TnsD family Tn7-like transposition protein n=1 Tax=Vibrio cholerae TaxID=666 RepID=UPI0011D78C77|nr:TnsD family Tn7-like transposition protein [Vibrio cholerae]TXZ26605.1 transposase [Vibrio cholerae]TYA77957.1 transposase [Vibrio cholerae]GIA21358.1 transposase [Vibrio cholerae]GIB52557.1 transposase [Vibrio cholerae]